MDRLDLHENGWGNQAVVDAEIQNLEALFFFFFFFFFHNFSGDSDQSTTNRVPRRSLAETRVKTDRVGYVCTYDRFFFFSP